MAVVVVLMVVVVGGEKDEKTRERDGESETDRQVREGFVLFACAGGSHGVRHRLGEAQSTKDNT